MNVLILSPKIYVWYTLFYKKLGSRRVLGFLWKSSFENSFFCSRAKCVIFILKTHCSSASYAVGSWELGIIYPVPTFRFTFFFAIGFFFPHKFWLVSFPLPLSLRLSSSNGFVISTMRKRCFCALFVSFDRKLHDQLIDCFIKF